MSDQVSIAVSVAAIVISLVAFAINLDTARRRRR